MSNSFFNELLQQLSERGRAMLGLARDAASRGDIVELSEHLLSGRGEASGVALARALVAAFVGYHAEPTIEGTSVATTRAVVNASLLVLMFNFVMSALLFQ